MALIPGQFSVFHKKWFATNEVTVPMVLTKNSVMEFITTMQCKLPTIFCEHFFANFAFSVTATVKSWKNPSASGIQNVTQRMRCQHKMNLRVYAENLDSKGQRK